MTGNSDDTWVGQNHLTITVHDGDLQIAWKGYRDAQLISLRILKTASYASGILMSQILKMRKKICLIKQLAFSRQTVSSKKGCVLCCFIIITTVLWEDLRQT